MNRRMCEECRKPTPEWCGAGRMGGIFTDLEIIERRIRQRFVEAEKSSTIVGEGYAERQIADSLSKVDPINLEPGRRKK